MLKINFINKIYIYIILTCILSLPSISGAECVWINKTGSLSGYEFTALAADKNSPDTIYVGSKGFLFKTVDGGGNWQKILKIPGIGKAVNFIAICPNDSKIIFIATESGVFRSLDGGMNWQSLPFGVDSDNVLTLLIDPENNGFIFAGTGKDIFVTKDGGDNWKKSSQGLSGINIMSMAQNYIDHNILFVSTDNGLFKSEDSGKSWTRVFSEGPIGKDNLSEYNESGGPLLSTTWVSIDLFDPKIIYFSAKSDVFKSADNGISWNRLTNIGMSNSGIKNLALPSYNKGLIFASTDEGIFRFSEKEGMWRELYAGLTSKDSAFVALDGREKGLWFITNNSIFKSKGDIYKIKEVFLSDKANIVLNNFSREPDFREIQEVSIKYAEVHPEKIATWRRAAQNKALLPKLSFGIQRDSSKNLHWDAGANPDRWVIGPEEQDTGWDVNISWDLGELIWNDDQTNIDVRSKLMVQLRDDVLDEVTQLYFERRRLQVELLQNPPNDVNKLIGKQLRLQELTADIDAMTGGYLSTEIERRKK